MTLRSRDDRATLAMRSFVCGLRVGVRAQCQPQSSECFFHGSPILWRAAQAHYHLHQTQQAKDAYAKAVKWFADQKAKKPLPWTDQVELQLLFRETAALLGETAPQVIRMAGS